MVSGVSLLAKVYSAVVWCKPAYIGITLRICCCLGIIVGVWYRPKLAHSAFTLQFSGVYACCLGVIVVVWCMPAITL